MEKWLQPLLLFFLEKHLIPTVGSLLLVVVTRTIIPNDCWIAQKIGNVFLCVGSFCLYFLLIFGCCKLFRTRKRKNIAKRENDCLLDDKIEDVMTFFDHCSPNQQLLAYNLLAHKNKPQSVYSAVMLFGVDSPWFDLIDYTKSGNNGDLVKFKDDFYNLLVLIYSRYGKISHFGIEDAADEGTLERRQPL